MDNEILANLFIRLISELEQADMSIDDLRYIVELELEIDLDDFKEKLYGQC